MKTKLLIFSFVLFTISTLSAHVITVSNNAITAGHFTTIQTAADSANVGDTIYVMGSPSDYGNVTIRTMVTMIGAGYAVTGTQYNYASIVDNIYIDSVSFGNQVSGTRILGMDVNSNLDYSGTGNINNIDIERCYVNNWIYVNGHNWTIRNCIMNYGVQVQSNAYIYVQNCFLGQVQYSNQTTVIFDHNNFVNNNSTVFYSVSNALVTNNVFYYDNPINGTQEVNCTFTNNITSASSTINLNAYAGNTGAGNIFSTPPGFTDATIPASYISTNTIWNYKWTFKPTSLAYHAATDGTDIGAYGGSYPMPNLTGATRIPQMTLMNVSGVAPAGGNLNVNFKAKIQN
jgi:hypothetical protein